MEDHEFWSPTLLIHTHMSRVDDSRNSTLNSSMLGAIFMEAAGVCYLSSVQDPHSQLYYLFFTKVRERSWVVDAAQHLDLTSWRTISS